MMDNRSTSKKIIMIFAGLLLGLVSIVLMSSAVKADSARQPLAQVTATPAEALTPTPTEAVPAKECIECHPDKKAAWAASSHAHAYDSANFQEGWKRLDQPTECLLCHTTNYLQSTGEYTHAGVSCEACHGTANADHPAVDYPIRSDKEYCGTCHPATLGEAQLSGHTGTADVGCMDCHDPHSQNALYNNPDDMCKECHKEDLAAMDKVQAELHLRENVTCAGCHTMDVPHTFLYNFRQEDVTGFMAGFDCSAEIAANEALQAESKNAQTLLQSKMNWPVVHRVSRAKSALKCADCHEMNEKLRADFQSLGYSDSDLAKLTWNDGEAPTVTDQDLDQLVSKSKPGWSWIYWLLGVALVFGIFEIFVSRRLRKPQNVVKEG